MLELDKQTYREDLSDRKTLNYGVTYLTVLDLIPATYEVTSFKFNKSSRWSFEMTLVSENGGTYDAIPKTKILENAEIKDIFENNQPGSI